MTTTRERLRVLVTVVESADGETFTSVDPAHERIALAAYRMALDDAAKACIDTKKGGGGTTAERCDAAVRALAEGL